MSENIQTQQVFGIEGKETMIRVFFEENDRLFRVMQLARMGGEEAFEKSARLVLELDKNPNLYKSYAQHKARIPLYWRPIGKHWESLNKLEPGLGTALKYMDKIYDLAFDVLKFKPLKALRGILDRVRSGFSTEGAFAIENGEDDQSPNAEGLDPADKAMLEELKKELVKYQSTGLTEESSLEEVLDFIKANNVSHERIFASLEDSQTIADILKVLDSEKEETSFLLIYKHKAEELGLRFLDKIRMDIEVLQTKVASKEVKVGDRAYGLLLNKISNIGKMRDKVDAELRKK